jgi:hypothetical protein
MDFLIDPDGTNWVEYYGGRQREFGTGNVIVPKLRSMGVGVAVLREEVPDPENPGRTIVVDAVTTVEEDGKKYQALQFGVLKLPHQNFWKKLTGMQRRYGTLCDRDYEITRHGGDKTTDYEVSAIDSKDDDSKDPEKIRARYGYGKKFEDSNPKRFLFCPQTLDEWVEYYSGQDRAKFWLEGASGGPKPVTVINSDGASVNGLDEFRQETSANPGWGNRGEDEAQPVPSQSSGFRGVKDQLREHFAKPDHTTD